MKTGCLSVVQNVYCWVEERDGDLIVYYRGGAVAQCMCVFRFGGQHQKRSVKLNTDWTHHFEHGSSEGTDC
jgi:hypothetical protein